MTRSTGNSYYVRTRGRVQGPLSLEKLRLLRARGQFGRASEVSLDGILWSPAAEFRELFEREPAAAAQPVDAGPEAATQPIDGDSLRPGVTVSRPPAIPWKPLLLAGGMLAMSFTLVITAWLATRDRDLVETTLDEVAVEEFDPDLDTTIEDMEPSADESQTVTDTESSDPASATVATGEQGSVDESAAADKAADSESAPDEPAKSTAPDEPATTPAEPAAPPEAPVSSAPPAHVIESATDPADEEAREAAIGLVVCGYRCKLKNGTVKEVIKSTGTCFMVSRAGYALTNRHVIEDTADLLLSGTARTEAKRATEREFDWTITSLKPTVWVFFGGERHVASIKHLSAKFDLAAIKCDCVPAAQFALRSDAALSKGLPVYALGYPGLASVPSSEQGAVESGARRHAAYASDFQDTAVETVLAADAYDFTLTNGIVSRHKVEDDGLVWVQHNAPISGGNSGGPLILEDGCVAGINTWGIAPVQGVHFALSMPQLRKEIDARVPGVVWK